ncbi:hypothetical protein A3219_22420 [Salmonella enterica]|nr:hypothetical protein A3219_22420 [Salmonella enterica]
MDMERRDNSSWVQLQPGINIGAWRVRNATSWQRSGQQSGKWQAELQCEDNADGLQNGYGEA